MAFVAARADDTIAAAVDAVRAGPASMADALNKLKAPLYVTDGEGRLTFCNQACAPFAGREPVVGEDRWCVTWRLYTLDGQFLPHEECPMAVAIRSGQPVRGVEAMAERPDGTRKRFRPYPTPLLDDGGKVVGAVNMLVEVGSSREQAEHLKRQAERCRRLAKTINDSRTAGTLELMAGDYEVQARELQLPN